MDKLYNKIVFHNDTSPALNETNLNAMSKAIDDIDDRSDDDRDDNGRQAGQKCLQLLSRLSEAECAAEKHHWDCKWHHCTGHNVLKCAHAFWFNTDITYDYSENIEQEYRSDFS